MKKIVVLFTVLLLSTAAIGTVSMRLCESDGNTPFDSNTPVMVGTRLTIYADSNSAASMWLGGLDLVKPVTNPDPPIGILIARGWDANAIDCNNSRFPAAGDRARVVSWENQDQQSFELFANGTNMAQGTWFVVDYNATNIGDCVINLVEYHDSNLVTVQSTTLHQVATRDFNNDGQVNFIDFAKLASYWLHTDCNELNDCEGTDLNPVPDGQIDSLDLMYFADFWLGRSRVSDLGGDANDVNDVNIPDSNMFPSSTSSPETQTSSSQQMPPLYLTCDTNSPDPNDEVTIYVHSDYPLFCMGAALAVTGDANIIDAMKTADCNQFGWDPGWYSDPYIDDANGLAGITGVQWASDVNGVVGYIKLRYHSGRINIAFYDAEDSNIAFSWDHETGDCSYIPFSQDALIIGRDPNEL